MTAFCALRPSGALTWRSALHAFTSTSASTSSNGSAIVSSALPIWHAKHILLSMCGATAQITTVREQRRRRHPKQPLLGKEERDQAVP